MGFGGHVSLFDEPCGVANTGPSLGKSDPQVHSEKCTMCVLSLTMRFGGVLACDWKNCLFVRGESEEEILHQQKNNNNKQQKIAVHEATLAKCSSRTKRKHSEHK